MSHPSLVERPDQRNMEDDRSRLALHAAVDANEPCMLCQGPSTAENKGGDIGEGDVMILGLGVG